MRTHNSVHKETIHSELFNTRVSSANSVAQKRFVDYDLGGRVFIATGGAQGLGLSMAEGLAEAGGKGESS